MLRFSLESGLNRRISCKIENLSIVIRVSATILKMEIRLSYKEALRFHIKLGELLLKLHKELSISKNFKFEKPNFVLPPKN